MGALEGVVMELNDAAFPLVHGIEISDEPKVAWWPQTAALGGNWPMGAQLRQP